MGSNATREAHHGRFILSCVVRVACRWLCTGSTPRTCTCTIVHMRMRMHVWSFMVMGVATCVASVCMHTLGVPEVHLSR